MKRVKWTGSSTYQYAGNVFVYAEQYTLTDDEYAYLSTMCELLEDVKNEPTTIEDVPPYVINFQKSTIGEIRKYCKEHNIELPKNITKKDDIISFLKG